MKRDFNINGKIDIRSRGGFSLLELVIVVVVLLVLSSIAAVNWSSFMRYQELRSEALALHRELMVQKAKALEINDTVMVVPNGLSYIVMTPVFDATTGSVVDTSKRVLSMNGMTVSAPSSNDMGASGALTLPQVTNMWDGTITIAPNGMEAFQNGWLLITGQSKKQFGIVFDKTKGINPEMYIRNEGGSWKKM